MLIAFLIIAILFLLAYSIFISFHAYRWARIIFLLEDKYSEALGIHERTLDTFEKLIKMQMFFDSPGVKRAVEEVMDDIKVCKMATQGIVSTLIEHSKRKYISEKDSDE